MNEVTPSRLPAFGLRRFLTDAVRLSVVFLIGGTLAARAVSLSSGDLIVTDEGASATTSGVVHIHPTNGTRTFITGNGVGGGANIDVPRLAVSTPGGGTLYYWETFASGVNKHIIALNPATGVRSAVPGGAYTTIRSMCWDPSTSTLLVADEGTSAANSGIVRINPTTGARTFVTGNGVGGGAAIDVPRYVTCAPNGTIYYFEAALAAPTVRRIISVDPATGIRSIVPAGTFATVNNTDTHYAGAMCWDPSTSTLLIIDEGNSPSESGVIRVNPTTGARTFVTGNGVGSGAAIDVPRFLACTSTGGIFYQEQGTKEIISVDAATGARTALPGGSYTLLNGLGVVPVGVPAVTSPLSAGGSYGTTIPTYTIAGSNSPTSFSASGLPPGLSVNTANGEITGTPTATGTFNVTIGVSNASGSATATLVLTIAKGNATVSLNSLTQTYNGSPRSATATTSPAGLTVNFTYNGSATVPTNAGSYEVVGTISDGNYQGSATGTLVVGKGAASVTLGNLNAIYNGGAQSASATTTPGGLTVTFTYNGSGTAPTNAGSYEVVGTINDANYQGSATGTFVIAKATASVTLDDLSATYDGGSHAASATTAPGGLTVTFTYEGSGTAPTNAGSYEVVGTINDANYQGSATGTFVIAKATASVALGDLSATYDGGSHAASATTAPGGLTVTFTYEGSGTAPTNAGSYEVVGTINDANYQGSATGTLVIAKATASVALDDLSATYDGGSHAASATTTPGGLTVTFTYEGSGTAPTNAGSYEVVGTINDANYQGSATGTLVIAKAGLTVTADPQVRAYGFANPTLTASVTGFVNGETTVVLSGAPELTTNANASSVPGNYDITVALGTLSAANYSFTPVDGVLTVTTQVIDDWRADNFDSVDLLDPAISGPDADPDLDGVSNLYEYAFGTDPNDIASGPFGLQYSGTLAGGVALVEEGAPTTVVEASGSGPDVRVLYLRRKSALSSDAEYIPQFSFNGSAWVDGGNTPTVLADIGLYELVSVPYPLTTGGKKTRFFRVNVELLP